MMGTKLSLTMAGLLLGIGLTLGLGAVAGPSQSGRYMVSSGPNDQVYILDTTDGHLWRRRITFVQDLGTLGEPILGPPQRVAGQAALDTEALSEALTGFLP